MTPCSKCACESNLQPKWLAPKVSDTPRGGTSKASLTLCSGSASGGTYVLGSKRHGAGARSGITARLCRALHNDAVSKPLPCLGKALGGDTTAASSQVCTDSSKFEGSAVGAGKGNGEIITIFDRLQAAIHNLPPVLLAADAAP
ncbi:hypothetical protein Y1Q_0001255 [Alligator mississippiensis]|uniref:Uncharacterized protein n=1 Tax=Alligator mississippiensis TaxID=8496 RepID=A0A151M8R8_ALLMI|nr:hypothetical protein Y1Q_0001255 [Alligator mississippiensis]